jgi:ABC-type nickel/cobalt efflux system permease component RcnA
MRRLVVAIAVLAALAAPAGAAAHPLGNFTVNRYAAVEISGARVFVHYALDLAEIPTFQQGARARRPAFAATIARGLDLRIDGVRARLTMLQRRIAARPGAGGLTTLRFEAVYQADRTGTTLSLRDRNFGARIGWKEVVVRASQGARLERSSAPARSVSDALRAYPEDLLRSPLDVTAAQAVFVPGQGPGVPPALGSSGPAERESSGFESLVSRDLSAGFVLVSLLVAVFWGAAHALGPGHGKAIVAGYLVGTRGTARHAFLLGGIVTLTHTAGVFALGLVTLALSEFIVPEDLYPWLNLVSALLVLGVGAGIVRLRVRPWLRARAHARAHAHGMEHDHLHDDGGHGRHHHDHDHHDHHHPEPGTGVRGLISVGISGGIVPCPTALVVLLAAISLHRVGYGLLLIVAFSAGLAASVTAIGLIAVTARRAFARMRLDGPLFRLLPAASALVVLALGVAMTVRALPPLV